MIWNLFKGTVAIGAAALIAGCGAGVSPDAYTITVRADARTLPLNIAGYGPNIGGPYTTTLYVEATDSAGHVIPGGEDIFQCSYVSGFQSGPLYYLDGDPEHETTETLDDGTEITTPNAYRAVVLGANAGAATFHFHAGSVAETATIRCSVQDPKGTMRSAETTIQVGSTPSGKVSQVLFTPFSPNYLFVQGMNNYTQVQAQLYMADEAGQPVPSPATGTNNMEINIWDNASSTAEDYATLRGVDADGVAVAGKSVKLRSINGQAQVTLVSGTTTGLIILEAVSDRYDNNVDNGIIERVSNLITVSVVTEAPGSSSSSTPLSIATESLPASTEDVPYGAVLQGSGGISPYTWSLVSGSRLPYGLSLASTGVITGTPYDIVSGTYNFVVQMRDAAGATLQKGMSIEYTATTTTVETAPNVSTTTLASCAAGASCVRTVSATGGKSPYTWAAVGLPPGLSMSANGVLNGIPTTAGNYSFAIVATGSNGMASTAQVVTLTVTPSTGMLTVMTTALPAGTVGDPYSAQILATGGTSPYVWSDQGLPSGLSINASGVIGGTPTVAGTFSIRVTVQDAASATAYRDLTLTIAP